MKEFLRDYWLWILIPFLLIGLLVVAVLVFGGEGTSAFRYDL